MKQARTIISTYSADVFGVCSALFELGGMTVMHDASGCNSTYSTHDEPRWYHSDSMVFISGLTEMQAIMGDDDKVLNDMLGTINELHPAFAALAGTPIPMMIGCDIPTIAMELERKSGIPCFGFSTNGIRSYLWGASKSLCAVADRFVKTPEKKREKTVNILGATPLDFSVTGTVPAIRNLLSDNGWQVLGTWAMDSTLEELANSGEAAVNLVISGVGLEIAELYHKKFGTPYVIGTPTGKDFSQKVLEALEKTEKDGVNRVAFEGFVPDNDCESYIIGEAVTARSLAASIGIKTGKTPKVIYPLESVGRGILTSGDFEASGEEEISEIIKNANCVIADPLYKPIVPQTAKFIPLPHEAFSGRLYRNDIPVLPALEIF